MKSLNLVPISISEIEWLNKTEYKNLSTERKKELVANSERGLCNGEFFRFYLIKDNAVTVGVINMCGHGSEIVSVAPEIIECYRKKGYAERSLTLAYSMAKEFGFKSVIADIREENFASQNLHVKLGFKLVKKRISKNGNLLRTYIKRI